MVKKAPATGPSAKQHWKEVKVGCILLEEGKAQPFERADKPALIPQWDKQMCVRCGLCYLFCPDAAIRRSADGYFEADADYCKGCGICHKECWFGAISMTEEG